MQTITCPFCGATPRFKGEALPDHDDEARGATPCEGSGFPIAGIAEVRPLIQALRRALTSRDRWDRETSEAENALTKARANYRAACREELRARVPIAALRQVLREAAGLPRVEPPPIEWTCAFCGVLNHCPVARLQRVEGLRVLREQLAHCVACKVYNRFELDPDLVHGA